MDDKVVFSPVLHRLTFGQAIEIKQLTDFEVVIVGVNNPMLKDWIVDGEILATEARHVTDARTLATRIAILKAIKDYSLRRLISSHGNIRKAKDFSEDIIVINQLL